MLREHAELENRHGVFEHGCAVRFGCVRRALARVPAVAGAILMATAIACGGAGASRETGTVGTGGRDAALTVGDAVRGAETGPIEVRGRVTRMAGARSFWIGGGGAEALVVLPASGNGVVAAGVRPGQDVMVRGTVHKGRGDDKAEGLDVADATAMRQADAYITADQVTPRK